MPCLFFGGKGSGKNRFRKEKIQKISQKEPIRAVTSQIEPLKRELKRHFPVGKVALLQELNGTSLTDLWHHDFSLLAKVRKNPDKQKVLAIKVDISLHFFYEAM